MFPYYSSVQGAEMIAQTISTKMCVSGRNAYLTDCSYRVQCALWFHHF